MTEMTTNEAVEAAMEVERIRMERARRRGETTFQAAQLGDLPEDESPVSYKPEVVADSSGEWTGNALRFATEAEAEVYAADLASRWMLVTATRVVESDDPVSARINDNKLELL
jgi:hypothetical protein